MTDLPEWLDMDHHWCVCGERPECGKRPRFFLWRWLTGTPWEADDD